MLPDFLKCPLEAFISANESKIGDSRRFKGFQLVPVGGHELRIETARQCHAEAIGQRDATEAALPFRRVAPQIGVRFDNAHARVFQVFESQIRSHVSGNLIENGGIEKITTFQIWFVRLGCVLPFGMTRQKRRQSAAPMRDGENFD